MRSLEEPATREQVVRGFRRQLEEIDHTLVDLLAYRFRAVAELWARKREEGIPFEDEAQEREVLSRAGRWARKGGLDPQGVETILRAVLEEAKRHAERELVGPPRTGSSRFELPPDALVGLSVVYLRRRGAGPAPASDPGPGSIGLDLSGK